MTDSPIQSLIPALTRKNDDNRTVTVADLLETALDDVRNGTLKNAIKCVIVIVEDVPDSPNHEWSYYRCGVTYLEEIGIMALATHRTIDKARK